MQLPGSGAKWRYDLLSAAAGAQVGDARERHRNVKNALLHLVAGWEGIKKDSA
jgi:hypothetical protein